MDVSIFAVFLSWLGISIKKIDNWKLAYPLDLYFLAS